MFSGLCAPAPWVSRAAASACCHVRRSAWDSWCFVFVFREGGVCAPFAPWQRQSAARSDEQHGATFVSGR
eukprot:8414976-Pyramimonas_sp.AAC.1